MNIYFEIGRSFAKGVVSVVGEMVVVFVVFLFAMRLIMGLTGIGVDSTDKSKWQRSGVELITDAKTGLQYLKTAGGGITPRLDANGNHMTEHGE